MVPQPAGRSRQHQEASGSQIQNIRCREWEAAGRLSKKSIKMQFRNKQHEEVFFFFFMFPKSSFKHTAVSQHRCSERSGYEPQLESSSDPHGRQLRLFWPLFILSHSMINRTAPHSCSSVVAVFYQGSSSFHLQALIIGFLWEVGGGRSVIVTRWTSILLCFKVYAWRERVLNARFE